MKLDVWDQREIVYLVEDRAPVVVDFTPLIINLSTYRGSLVIDLIAGVAGVILVKPCVKSLIAAIALVRAYIGSGYICLSIAAILLNELIILLQCNILVLATYRIALIAAAILIEASVFSLIATVALMASHTDRMD